MTLGFIGAGTIAAAFIEGLHRGGKSPDIVVSPRSEATSRMLEETFIHVRRAASNAHVVEASDIVFLAMRPSQVEEALEGVTFRPEQIVVSFVTGLSLHEIARIAPVSKVCRVLPLPAVARRKGPIICHPPLAQILALLDGMGDLVLPESEAELLALGSVSGFMSSYFELQKELADWLSAQGVESARSSLYVRSMLASLGDTALTTPLAKVERLPAEHETKGGLNQRVRDFLGGAGWFRRPADAFEEIRKIGRTGLK